MIKSEWCYINSNQDIPELVTKTTARSNELEMQGNLVIGVSYCSDFAVITYREANTFDLEQLEARQKRNELLSKLPKGCDIKNVKPLGRIEDLATAGVKPINVEDAVLVITALDEGHLLSYCTNPLCVFDENFNQIVALRRIY